MTAAALNPVEKSVAVCKKRKSYVPVIHHFTCIAPLGNGSLCGKPFTSRRSDAETCSPRCKKALTRQRRDLAYPARSRIIRFAKAARLRSEEYIALCNDGLSYDLYLFPHMNDESYSDGRPPQLHKRTSYKKPSVNEIPLSPFIAIYEEIYSDYDGAITAEFKAAEDKKRARFLTQLASDESARLTPREKLTHRETLDTIQRQKEKEASEKVVLGTVAAGPNVGAVTAVKLTANAPDAKPLPPFTGLHASVGTALSPAPCETHGGTIGEVYGVRVPAPPVELAKRLHDLKACTDAKCIFKCREFQRYHAAEKKKEAARELAAALKAA